MKRSLFIALVAIVFIASSAQAAFDLIDATFNPGLDTDMLAEAAAVQSDGKIVIAGAFPNYNGVPRKFIVRLR